MDQTHPAAFAYALEDLPGVGRVTTGRILDQFSSYERMLRYPREQVILRLKGVAHASDLVARLTDIQEMSRHIDRAKEQLSELASRGISVLAPHADEWPEQLADLPNSRRPNLLYCYGRLDLLTHPAVSIIARPPLSQHTFERAQELIRHLIEAGIPLISGISSGFDVVALKLSASSSLPAAMVAGSGLARIGREYRPLAAAAVKRGGLLCSSLPMGHGPFDHDDAERLMIQAALGKAVVFVEPSSSRMLEEVIAWTADARRPVFAIPNAGKVMGDHVHPVLSPDGFDWVVAACGGTDTAQE